MTTLFWILAALIVFTYLGYGLLLRAIAFFVKPKRNPAPTHAESPSVTMVIAAYNEADVIAHKLRNSLSLNYPAEKLQILVVTDGSSDQTPDIARRFSGVDVFHSPERAGKTAAINRILPFIKNEVVVFTDANTELNDDALRNLSRHFCHPLVAAVAGEKRVISSRNGDSASGEGLYWKYESWLKSLDSRVASVVGAAGELWAIRKFWLKPVGADIILDDFILSTDPLKSGFRTVYEPAAIATEYGSVSFDEEMKRKVRIAAGGIQSILMQKRLFNVFTYGRVSLIFTGHRVLRWTLTPLALLLLPVINIPLAAESGFYAALLALQTVFYASVGIAYLLRTQTLPKLLLIPFYFGMMNVAVIRGWFRFAGGTQSAVWERAVRQAA